MTEQRQQETINEAAEKFTNALVESYRSISERGVAAQEQNAQLTEEFFNRVINNLRSQAEENRQLTQQLSEQQQRQREATQALTQESVTVYMDFVNSMFSYFQGNVEQAQRQTQQAQREAQQ